MSEMNKSEKDDIYEAIYAVVRLCPKGRVTTYGAVAAAVGARSGARLVGYAMTHCKGLRPKVPSHRVVNRNGLLTGRHHFATPTEMEELLKKEGVKVKDHQVQDFSSIIWEPLKEL